MTDSSKKESSLVVLQKLKSAGYEAYFAGGSVRDMLLNREPKDYDIATNAKPDDVEKMFKKTVLVGKQFGVVKVIHEGCEVEVTTFRSEGPYVDGRRPSSVSFVSAKEDVSRRDFTVNGLLYDPVKDEVLDFVGGKKDIKDKLIRCIGNPEERFEEDKLRMMRAVRFAVQLDFKIESDTFNAVKKLSGSIIVVSWERIQDEFRKILAYKNRTNGVKLLVECGLLRYILPELLETKGVQQPPEFHPEGDVWTHTLLTLEKLNSYDFDVSLGALLHDIGKPRAFAMRNGKMTYYKHEHIGEEIAESICKRLKLSNDETESVKYIVRNHLRFKDVKNMKVSKLKRFLQEKLFDRLKLAAIADTLASNGNMEFFEFIDDFVKKQSSEELKPNPFITGNDLIGLGLKPGPVFSKILDEVYDKQLEGKVKTREQALSYLKKFIP
ncbi:MAG: CCA tRNA nucleotidyltransferase [Planctomycetes bacterium]|nr:CCA tRNA nucleotidyltransferase [Planctomycetota bacterium]